MPHAEWSAMSSEQKMEFLYNWCLQMSEWFRTYEQPQDAHGQAHFGRCDGCGAAFPTAE